MRSNLHLRFFLSWALAVFGASAQAYTVTCVSTVGGLNAALIQARSANSTTVIELQQGTYHVGSTSLASNGGAALNAVQLLGGYDSGCNNRTVNPENTILDGDNVQGTGIWGNLYMQGSLTIEGIRFQHFPGSFSMYTDVDSLSITVRYDEFIGNGFAVYDDCGNHDNLYFENNLGVGGGIYVTSACGTNATDLNTIVLTGNTVAGVGSGASGIYVGSAGSTALYNNISWNPTAIDIQLEKGAIVGNGQPVPASALFVDNTYGSKVGSEANGSTGDDPSDPQFIGNGNYRLQSTSASVNTGDISALGLTNNDLDGNSRIIGGTPDRGAYESNVDTRTIGTILTVTSTGDNGGANPAPGAQTGTLRQAIVDANYSGGTHYIEFNINDGGSCPWVINTASDLPYITASGLSINGFTQPGSKKNVVVSGFDFAKRCIVLNGQGRASSMGLTFYGASSGFYWVQGLAFEGWGLALNISAGQNNLVWGNQFGGTLYFNSQQLTPNGIDIWLCGGTTSTTIGGADPSNRNTIGSADGAQVGYGGDGIALSAGCGSGGNSIVNNIIGFDWNENPGTSGNAIGIQLETANNIISGNVIGNNNNGIQVLGSGANNNKIHDNLIGLTESPLCVIGPCPAYNNAPNQAGIYFWQGANSNFVYNNTITNNTLFGIEMTGTGTYRNEIYSNSIFGNPASWAAGGAEVNLDGYAYGFNDPNSTAPDRGLNSPAIDSVIGSGSRGTLVGHLASSNDFYLIEVYSSPTCEAGGAFTHAPYGFTSISNATGTANGTGGFKFDFTSTQSISLSGRYITATAIDSNGNSSQFSACKLYQCDVIFRNGFDSVTGEHCP